MNKVLAFLLTLLICVSTVYACPTNELIYNTLTPLSLSYEKRDGSGEDIAGTANKRIAISYWDGAAVKWWNGTDWTSTTEQLLTMTQVTGSQYRYNFTPNATVSGQFLMIRYDETDNIDVTKTCVVYVQPVNRFDDTVDYVKLSSGTGTGQISLSSGAVLLQPTQTGVTIPTVTSVTNGVALAANAVTPASIQDGAIGADEVYLVAGTENVVGVSTTLKIYTTLGVTNERKWNNMCLYAASNGERSRILSTGNGFFNVRGFGTAPTDGSVLRVYSDGCL